MLFGVALAVQLVLLYWPRAVQPAGGLPWDKIVHALIFGVVYAAGVRAGVPRWPWFAVSVLHAPVSELVQDALLPRRSGDPYDAVADVAGVVLAAAGMAIAARRRGTPAVRTSDSTDGAWRAE